MTESQAKESQRPPWLKAMENGGIAEARSRAFLMDRFWILERSVDIEGADLIIQRKLTNASLLDSSPPRFGYVQVKFSSGPTISHQIHEKYLIGADGKPRDEFFLMVHTGHEDSTLTFLLTASDVIEMGRLPDQADRFILSSRHILSSDRFRVTSPKLALDRMEHTLRFADLSKNRRLMQLLLPSLNIDIGQILPQYHEPLDYWMGDIPGDFQRVKRTAQGIAFDLLEVAELFSKASQSADPDETMKILEEIYREYRDSFSFPHTFYDEDFHTAILEHQKRRENLKNAGVLDGFLTLQARMIQFVSSDLPARLQGFSGKPIYELVIYFDPTTLLLQMIEPCLFLAEESPEHALAGRNFIHNTASHGEITLVGKGKVKIHWRFSGYTSRQRSPGETLEAFLISRPPLFIADLMNMIYTVRFPDPTAK